MTTPYIGEIQIFGFSFNPRGWALCNGSTLQMQQNTALFSLLGYRYGGSGQSFQLPNFTARSACEQGTGPGLSNRQNGEAFGTAAVALALGEMPAHSHGINYFSQSDTAKRHASPVVGDALSVPTDAAAFPFVAPGAFDLEFSPNVLGTTGHAEPHSNQQPYLAVNFCIALQGEFPSFS